MKKLLLVSMILLSGILLTACGKKDEESTENVEPTEVVEISDCEKAIQKYLDWADKVWFWEEIKEWDNITVDYIWRLEDGTVFDTSIESIAKACWKYITWWDYSQWLSFEVWTPWLIKWFNEWVIWMKVWQTKTVQFWPKEWYWEYDKEAIVTAPIAQFWDISNFKEWDMIDLWMWIPAKIIKITDKEISFDFNHELAWKSLIFDITIKENFGSDSAENIQNTGEITSENE